MNHIANQRASRRTPPILRLCIPLLLLTSACDSAIVDEAQRAEDEGAVVNNGAMEAMYPETFRPGSPAYLERDFEAGADFICDEIKAKQNVTFVRSPIFIGGSQARPSHRHWSLASPKQRQFLSNRLPSRHASGVTFRCKGAYALRNVDRSVVTLLSLDQQRARPKLSLSGDHYFAPT
ncbi:hypothetical protein [Sphingopyxis sp. C-1]|uniref:hypothetical protein n=1 Tax=Sphingopyxis sp. C-1 TaxID=262667 RepID=UPI0006C67C10|nr:hypothetical protein [Sphingopyxis sp. C-1]GAO79034.1 hypothetical protein SC1_02352 [Sphingopyxis sp. C-1]